MSQQNVSIWIWLQFGKIIKAILCPDDGTIRIFDEDDKLILKRTGLNRIQIKQIENNIMKYGAKKLSQHAEPFKFL
ncbi:MAG: hypothetical protein JXA91_05635 [Candidatus Thermoplasmatota archaeon]|nr:hypothetical protein [Candidatus Thermoplasmatota archaeon]